MRILLACGAGLSTSVLMKRMQKWANENGKELKIDAMATHVAKDHEKDYDCALIAPQVSYQIDQLKKELTIPVAAIAPYDYAIGNAENIMKLAYQITGLEK